MLRCLWRPIGPIGLSQTVVARSAASARSLSGRFGIADDAFLGAQSYPGEFGDLVRDFWVRQNACDGVEQNVTVELDPDGECFVYSGCSNDVRYCLYGPSTGHQIPDYYPSVTMEWFRSF